MKFTMKETNGSPLVRELACDAFAPVSMKLTEALPSIIITTFEFYSAALFVAFLLITYTTIQILKCARSSKMIISMMRSYCLLRDSSDRRIVSSLGIPSGLSTARATRGSTYIGLPTHRR